MDRGSNLICTDNKGFKTPDPLKPRTIAAQADASRIESEIRRRASSTESTFTVT
jgi:hypothetical protein